MLWTIKKSKELVFLICSAGEDSWEFLELKEIKPVNPKGNQSWIFIGRMDAEAEALWQLDAKSQILGRDPDVRKDWRQKEKGVVEDEMVRLHHWLSGHEFEQTLGHSGGWRSLACYSPWSHKELVWLSNWTTANPMKARMNHKETQQKL